MRFRLVLLALIAVLPVALVAPATAEGELTVTITAPDQVFAANRSLNVGVDVTNADGAQVAVVRTYAGNPEPYFCTGGDPVYDQHFNCEVFLWVNTTVTVTVGGEVKAQRLLRVRPVIQTVVRSGFVKSGAYHVMKAGTAPRFVSYSTPGFAGKMCLKHEVQRYRNAAWRTVVLTGCRTMLDKGKVIWTWTGSHPRAVNFRVRAVFPGNAVNAAGPGRWTYFRFR